MANEQSKNYGAELIRWEVSDQSDHVRGAFWYIFAAVAAISFLVWAIATRNFLFAFIVIMFGVIFATHRARPSVRYEFVVSELGIRLGRRFYPWKDITRFSIVYEPPEVKTLYFDFGGLRPQLPVPLEDTDPNQVRKILLTVLTEDTARNEEPLSDWIARVLKI